LEELKYLMMFLKGTITMINLDYLCIKYGQQMAKGKDSENTIRKALGVLQEDGVYAMFLWLETKNKEIRTKITPLLKEDIIKKYLLNGSQIFPEDFMGFCEKLKDIAKDIDKLLFMKKILERTLIYSLYHAKIGEK